MVNTEARKSRKKEPQLKASAPLRLPHRTTPPAFDSNVWGGRFPDRRYYPLYLANGRDATLINISGSGDGHWERAPYSADVLSKLHAIGWYKADRRQTVPDSGVYGPLTCLGEFTACPRLHNDYVVPRNIRQYFDPKSATLTTFFSQLDDRSSGKLELRMETYMCSQGVLIQEIEILDAPPGGAGYAFSLSSASPGYQNHTRPLTAPETCDQQVSSDGTEALMTCHWPGLKAVAFSAIGGITQARTERRPLPHFSYEELEQTITGLPAGARFWRAVSFQDDREGDDPAQVCQELLEELRTNGIQSLRDQHLLEWEEYYSKSNVEIPDPATQYIYDLSRYLMKANHHPQGFQPVGLLPYQWQGVMFWDATFVQEAFLTCGNEKEAKAIASQIKNLLPEGRKLAARLENSGARIEWTANLDSFTSYEPPSRQFHNNGVWAKNFCLLGKYLGQDPAPDDLAAAEELLQFLIEEYERHGSAKGHDFAFVGIDESSDDPKPYDTWTFAVLLHALECYFAICSRQNHKPAFPRTLLARIQDILDANIDDQGVLQSFRGGRLPHWGSLIFDMFPDHPAAMPTISRMAENYDPEQDLFNFHGLNRYAEKTFPWSTFTVVRCLAKMGRPEALKFFLHNLNHVNYFGGFSERLYYHGEHYIEWFSTGHAALVLSMNAMLATEVNGRIRLLGGLDLSQWRTLSFKELHAGDGWVVSLELEDGLITNCLVTNLCPESRPLHIEIPPLGLCHTQEAGPGTHSVLLSNHSAS